MTSKRQDMQLLEELDFEVPEHLQDAWIDEIGPYKLLQHGTGVFIQGIQLINLTAMPITAVNILPLSYEKTKELLSPPSFEFTPDKVVFQVSYGGFAWYFYDYGDALSLVNALVKLKAIGLGWSES